jgi:predicted O-methyltransferase YrrM
MTKRQIILGVSAALVLTAAAAAVLVFAPDSRQDQTAAGAAQAPALGVAKDEVTIRNVTNETVRFELRPYGAETKPVPQALKPGEIVRYPATRIVVITYEKYGREVSYSLTPGRPYSFRFDSAGKVDIWAGAHGLETAVDLAPWVPTPPEVIVKMCELAEIDQDDVVYDIGCGDGRIVIFAAKAYGARGVGIDIDPERIKESKASAKRAGVEKLVTFKLADATTVEISEATALLLYLLPESNELLRPKFEKELKPGTPVVTHNYMIPGWESKEITSEVVKDTEGVEHSVFLYRR